MRLLPRPLVAATVAFTSVLATPAAAPANDDTREPRHSHSALSEEPIAHVERSVDQAAALRDLRAGSISPEQLAIVGGPGLRGPWGGETGGEWGGELRKNTDERGVTIFSYTDGLHSIPVSDDPVFDRFQVGIAGQVNPAGGQWFDASFWYIPTLFVDDQPDRHDPTLLDPLPRWQGVTLTENDDAGSLVADLNDDFEVDMADLGLLVGAFGSIDAPGENPADVNRDGVVDTADLGVLISQYGQSGDPFCIYQVNDTHGIDSDGDPIDPDTLANAPVPGEMIAVLKSADGASGGDVGCPDCGFFRIRPESAKPGEHVYGDWTLADENQTDLSGVRFRAVVDGSECSGWGNDRVLADTRSEIGLPTSVCCFHGARRPTPLFAPTPEAPVNIECDVFMTSYDTFSWYGAFSSADELTVTRVFMGGFTPSLNPEFTKFSTRPDLLLNHFIFIGRQPDELVGLFFSTAPDPLVGNEGKEILLNEWFTIRFQLTPDSFSIWLKDSETMALTDPSPGDDGAGTPLDGSDDIENGFAKIFPIGPYGIAPGVAPGQLPAIPHPAIATSMDQFRFLYGGDPTPDQFPAYSPRPIFFDNMRIDGPLKP